MGNLRGSVFKTTNSSKKTIFVEATHTAKTSLNTGLQRVVRNVIRNLDAVARARGADIEIVTFEQGVFTRTGSSEFLNGLTADREEVVRNGTVCAKLESVLCKLFYNTYRGFLRVLSFLLPSKAARKFVRARADRVGLTWYLLAPWRRFRERSNKLPAQNNVLLLIDATWGIEGFWQPVEAFKKRGGQVVGVVYDIIPISHPEFCVPELSAVFGKWLPKLISVADGIICISKFTASCVDDFADQQLADGLIKTKPRVSYFHLGSDLDLTNSSEQASIGLREIFNESNHIFLVVGSIEPRKNHAYILDAFDRLWSEGQHATLVIIGKVGWKNDELLARITEHPKYNSELYLIRDASDADLGFCYENGSALIFASKIEGFGLPIVEAFQRGLPVLCSDIPVFREIADGKAIFFDLSQPDSLTSVLVDFCNTHSLDTRRVRSPQPYLSWEQSTAQLIDETLRICQRPD